MSARPPPPPPAHHHIPLLPEQKQFHEVAVEFAKVGLRPLHHAENIEHGDHPNDHEIHVRYEARRLGEVKPIPPYSEEGDFVCYTADNATGCLNPMIASIRVGESPTYRDLKTKDIPHISPLPGKLEHHGGSTLFVRCGPTSQPWGKKFVQIRGLFMFIFNAAGAEKPVACIPLNACHIIEPKNKGKNYETKPAAMAEVGWEFKLLLEDGIVPSTRFYCTTAAERDAWVQGIADRIAYSTVQIAKTFALLHGRDPHAHMPEGRDIDPPPLCNEEYSGTLLHASSPLDPYMTKEPNTAVIGKLGNFPKNVATGVVITTTELQYRVPPPGPPPAPPAPAAAVAAAVAPSRRPSGALAAPPPPTPQARRGGGGDAPSSAPSPSAAYDLQSQIDKLSASLNTGAVIAGAGGAGAGAVDMYGSSSKPPSRRPSGAGSSAAMPMKMNRIGVGAPTPLPPPTPPKAADNAAAAAQPQTVAGSRRPSAAGAASSSISGAATNAPSITPEGCLARSIIIAPAEEGNQSVIVQLTMGFESGLYVLLANGRFLNRIARVGPGQEISFETPLIKGLTQGSDILGFNNIGLATRAMTMNMTSAQGPGPGPAGAAADNSSKSSASAAGAGAGAAGKGKSSSSKKEKAQPATVREGEGSGDESVSSSSSSSGSGSSSSTSSSLSSEDKASTPEKGKSKYRGKDKGKGKGKGKEKEKKKSKSRGTSDSPSGGPAAADGPLSALPPPPQSASASASAPALPLPAPSGAGGTRRASLSLKAMAAADLTISDTLVKGLSAITAGKSSNSTTPNSKLAGGAGVRIANSLDASGEGPSAAMLLKRDHTSSMIFGNTIRERALREEEGRRREQICYDKMNDENELRIAQATENANPLKLAELLKILIFFQGHQLVGDISPENPTGSFSLVRSSRGSLTPGRSASINRAAAAAGSFSGGGEGGASAGSGRGLSSYANSNSIPFLKGEWAENMVVSVYKHYTNDSGFMSLEEFVHFMSDSGIVNTHCPHNEFDLASIEIAEQLDPVRLLTTIPKSSVSGIHNPSENIASAALQEALKDDKFTISFTQFYLILFRISQIVYPAIYTKNRAMALNKVLVESVLPLYVWNDTGHIKNGSTDPLVSDERIALLFMTYAPNLWKVFLSYAINSQQKHPSTDLPWPNYAQASETALFGTPKGCPYISPEARNAPKQSLTTRTTHGNELNKDAIQGNKANARRMSRVTLSSSVKTINKRYSFMGDIDHSHGHVRENQWRGAMGADNGGDGPSHVSDEHTASRKNPHLFQGEKSLVGSGTSKAAAFTVEQLSASMAAQHGLFITDAKLLQLCSDFGIANDLLSRRDIAALAARLNGEKKISLGRTTTKIDSAPTTASGKEGMTQSQKLKSRRGSVLNMVTQDAKYAQTVAGTKVVSRGALTDGQRPVVSMVSVKPLTGLSFSEFLEFIGQVAVQGMDLPHFTVLFPTPFAKVLALLTVWGLADTKKLEAVLLLHVDIVL